MLGHLGDKGTARKDARPPITTRRESWEGERPREPSPADTFPQRHKLASGVFINLGQPTIVILTVCTDQHQPWLAQPTVHAALRQVWGEARAWLVGYYLLMPNHLHLFCAPHDLAIPLNRWVSYWKRRFTQRTRNPDWIWQAHYWDTRLRRSENYTNKWGYVAENPVRKQLVARTEDWPYQGRLNELRW